MRFTLFLPLLVVAFLLNGCAGYHIGPIQPKFMTGFHKLTIPALKNDSLEPRIEVSVANALINQFQQDGTYQIVDSNDADAIIKGTIMDVRRRSARSIPGNVLQTLEYTLELKCQFTVIKRATNEVIDTRTISGVTSFFVSGTDTIASDVNTDERQAIPLAAQDLAVQYVSIVSEGW